MSKDTVRETVYSSEPRNTVDLCDATFEHYRWFSESNPDIVRSISHGHWEPPPKGKELYVTFVDKDGNEDKVAVNEGDNLLTVAQANDIEMEGMSPKCACEGSCSCSTCHVIVQSEDMFDKMPEADDEENDMLDLAFGLTETSRLGCQIIMKPELDGLVVKLPSTTRNMQASDFAKKKK
ncbi:related to electron transfer protein [Rhynchosporium graminicola]|uniref:Related to electron transfer protein n=1 Tax=Rhynchosporium graminicola TaxID=2792576 RepID=A0A1E1JUD4_9HELO|nr:related to electron transfer protein [Rhynchosporium commune]